MSGQSEVHLSLGMGALFEVVGVIEGIYLQVYMLGC